MANFRTSAFNLSPSRLRTDKAVRFVYSFIGIPLDTIAESATQALEARFPERCPEDALPYHGRDRGIVRGPHEPSASYRKRLILWLEAWRGAGVGKAMLDQVAGFLAPHATRIRLWTQVGVVYTLEADGSFRVERAVNAWNWDQRPELWARFWLLIYSANDTPWSRDGLWGDGGTWGTPEVSWGSTATVSEAETIRGIVDQWKPAAALCEHIMIVFNDAAFDPLDPLYPLPDGTWGEYWDSPSLLASRTHDALYWKGV
jgi:hypothetical protein